MQMLFIVLNKVDCLEDLLSEFAKNDINGATIIDSRGMAQSLYSHDELRFIASLRMFLDPDRRENKTIFLVLEDASVPKVSQIVNRITGGLDQPDTGILFTVPVQYFEGTSYNK